MFSHACATAIGMIWGALGHALYRTLKLHDRGESHPASIATYAFTIGLGVYVVAFVIKFVATMLQLALDHLRA